MKILIKSLADLRQFAQILQRNLPAGRPATIALIGELGAGKTAFSRFFLRAAGINKNVTSPTFVLMNRYQKSGREYYHIDLYRTKNFKEIAALGIPELWSQKNAVLLIEWADKIRRKLPAGAVILKFQVKPGFRQIEILNAPAKLAKMLG